MAGIFTLFAVFTLEGLRDSGCNLRRCRPAAEVGEFLVNAVFLVDVVLSLSQQRCRLLRTRERESLITQFVVSVVLERNGRPWRIQTERSFTDLAHRRVVAEERPIAAGRG